MILWRISNHPTLDGRGGLKASGRWHTRGRCIVYCAANPAAALLEILGRNELRLQDLPDTYQLMKVSAPDDLSSQNIEVGTLPQGWRTKPAATRAIGDAWLAGDAAVLLSVPSVIVSETRNILINPAHKESRRIKIVEVQEHLFDERLRPARASRT